MSARLFPVPTNDQSESGFAVAKSPVHRGGKPLINLVVKNAWLGLRALVAPPDKFRIINLQRWFSLPHPGLPKVPLFPRENLCIGGIIHFRSHRSIDAEVFPGRISLPSPGLLVCLLAPRGIDARRSIGKSWADRSSQSQGNPSRRQTTVDTHGFYLPLGPFDSPDDFAIGRDRGSTLTVPGCPSPSSCLSPPLRLPREPPESVALVRFLFPPAWTTGCGIALVKLFLSHGLSLVLVTPACALTPWVDTIAAPPHKLSLIFASTGR